mmetsp:Transcript_9698/g.41602  ORF Transcript_9698/g.41602 Transcript_9698/m.41602 type:complete len:234 (+) Transcript_9698:298-999(+)
MHDSISLVLSGNSQRSSTALMIRPFSDRALSAFFSSNLRTTSFPSVTNVREAYREATNPHNPAPAPSSRTFLPSSSRLRSETNAESKRETGHSICPVRSWSVQAICPTSISSTSSPTETRSNAVSSLRKSAASIIEPSSISRSSTTPTRCSKNPLSSTNNLRLTRGGDSRVHTSMASHRVPELRCPDSPRAKLSLYTVPRHKPCALAGRPFLPPSKPSKLFSLEAKPAPWSSP